MAKYTKLNELQKAIDKVNVDVAEMQQPIAVLEDKRTEVITTLQGLEAEVSEMLEDSSRMVAMEYFKKRQKISDYQRQITMLDSNIAELKENAKIVEKGLNKQLYEDYLDTDYVDTHPVINEFEENTLELQREAFALMCQVEKVMDKMELKALGKINLGLDVLGRRENGYHDVRMVMQTVYLYDQIRIEKTKKPGIELSTNLFYLPVNENNLAYQAADLLMKEFDVKEGVKITLDKHIPVAAGMAGGSSNAAAVLFGINRMFSLGLSQKELMERGVTLGADVPYCVMRGTVLAEGIGEILTPLPACPKCHVLIAKPPISVSTKLVYEKLDSHEIEDHPDIDGIIDGLKAHDIEKVASSMGNVLEKVTIEEYPVIEQIKNVMKEQGALNAMMSGSGPTVFGIYDSKEKARKAAAKIREKQLAKQVYVTGIHNARRK